MAPARWPRGASRWDCESKGAGGAGAGESRSTAATGDQEQVSHRQLQLALLRRWPRCRLKCDIYVVETQLQGIVPVAFGGTILLSVLGYYALFPTAYWQARELADNRTKWEGQNVSNYQMLVDLPLYALKESQKPATTVTVVVRQGKLVSMMDVQGKALPPENAAFITSSYSELLTIPGLFS